jgi:hypothetical protein
MCAQCTRACAAAGVLYVCGSVQCKVVGLLSVPLADCWVVAVDMKRSSAGDGLQMHCAA